MQIKSQKGFTLTEMLVSMGLFSIFSVGISSFLAQTFKNLGTENRTSMASMELRNALGVMTSELRMGASVSPYLPGDDAALSRCSSSIAVTSTTLRFLIVHDDATALSGLKTYYVGYRYDSATNQLLRGEIASNLTNSCTMPAGDPTSNAIAQVIARNVTAVDINGDAVNEPIFSYTAPMLTVNMGASVKKSDGQNSLQKVSTKITLRTL